MPRSPPLTSGSQSKVGLLPLSAPAPDDREETPSPFQGRSMTEEAVEETIEESEFAKLLQTHAESFFRLSNLLRQRASESWNPKHYFQLINETNALESFLDDYGARYNKEYSFFTELTASLRGFAQAGYSVAHLQGRIYSYGLQGRVEQELFDGALQSAGRARAFIRKSMADMFEASIDEARRLGVGITADSFPEEGFLPVEARQALPRNVGVADLHDEGQKIAEVASKFSQAFGMLDGLGIRRIEDPDDRRRFLVEICTEEQARVYEATIHNLQSAYDTYIKNTVLELRDERLPLLRGFATVSLHLLEAVTNLTHFYERHETDIRSEEAKSKISALIDARCVQDVILHDLLLWAWAFMRVGHGVAEDLLPAYTDARELEVVLTDDLILHARPAALIVGIVNHYGTPVQMEVGSQSCNAASILELLLTVGSQPNEKRFVFRGDATPLQDIALLFENDLGEHGIEKLPAKLGYLRNH